jgi:hypothetical protein
MKKGTRSSRNSGNGVNYGLGMGPNLYILGKLISNSCHNCLPGMMELAVGI